MSSVLMEREVRQLAEREAWELLDLNEVQPSHVHLEEGCSYRDSDVLLAEELLLCAICWLLQENHKFENFNRAEVGPRRSVLENRFIGFRIKRDEPSKNLDRSFGRDFEVTLQSCLHRKMLQETSHDEWWPGMKSRAGIHTRYTVTPLGKRMVRESVFKASEPKPAIVPVQKGILTDEPSGHDSLQVKGSMALPYIDVPAGDPKAMPAIDPCPKTRISRPNGKKTITAKDGRTREERELAVRHELMKRYYDDKEPVLNDVAEAIGSTKSAVRRTMEWQNRDVLRTSMQLLDGPTARDSGMDVEFAELIEDELPQRTSDSILSVLKYVDHERLFAELAALGEGDLERLNSKINRTNPELRELTMSQVREVIEDDPKLAAQTIVSLVSTVK